MRTTVGDLIRDAITSGKNTTASNGRWKCRVNKEMNTYIVTHHKTDMLVFDATTNYVYPLSEGWGSQTDKQGITSMLGTLAAKGYYPSAKSYHELYVEEAGTQGTKNPPIAYEEPEEPKPKLERFHPPITVEDTIV